MRTLRTALHRWWRKTAPSVTSVDRMREVRRRSSLALLNNGTVDKISFFCSCLFRYAAARSGELSIISATRSRQLSGHGATNLLSPNCATRKRAPSTSETQTTEHPRSAGVYTQMNACTVTSTSISFHLTHSTDRPGDSPCSTPATTPK
jgi:hypothetical protein